MLRRTRWNNYVTGRHRKALGAAIQEIFRTNTLENWLEILEDAGCIAVSALCPGVLLLGANVCCRRNGIEDIHASLNICVLIWCEQGPIATLPEVCEDPQLRANNAFQEVHHPVAGTFETVGQ